MVTGNLSGGDLMKYVSIILALFLFATGIVYIFIQCCCADKVEAEVVKKDKLLGDEERNRSVSKVKILINYYYKKFNSAYAKILLI